MPISLPAVPTAEFAPSLALLDDPQEWWAFGRPLHDAAPEKTHADASDHPPPEAQRWESHVVLQGMFCAACALNIEDALRAVPGVESVEVSGAAKRARVVWRPAQVLPSAWMAAVEKIGYSAQPAMDALARQERQSERRRALWRWLVAGFCMMQVMMYAWPAYVAQPGDLSPEMERLLRWASWVITLPVVCFACGPFFSNALRDLRQRRISMDLPVAIGMAITFVVSTIGTFSPDGIFGREVFFDSLTMFVFFLLTGRWLELGLRERTAGALEAVMNRLPDSVLRREPADGAAETAAAGGQGDENFVRVATRRLQVGDVLRVLAGEAFPVDGVVLAGSTQVDEALLTGESKPVHKSVGSKVAAGSYNLSGPLTLSAQSVGAHTRFAEIVALMESAAVQKPRLALLADRIARPFLWAVMLAAALAAMYWWRHDPGHALMVAVAVLIVTCPCALSLATPVAMLTAAGTLARQGVLVQQLQALETLAKVDTFVFDKTGTLTHDGMKVQAVHTATGGTPGEALQLALVMSQHSIHPVSRAVTEYAQTWLAAHTDKGLAPAAEVIESDETDEVDTAGEAQRWQVHGLQEIPGRGLVAQIRDGWNVLPERTFLLGSLAHVGAAGVPTLTRAAVAQQVVLALCYDSGMVVEIARFDLSESLRDEAAPVLQKLRAMGMALHLFSGDSQAAVSRVASAAGIEDAHGECSPQDKWQLLQALQAKGHTVAMVGDGLNDGPVLAGAHVSFAFGRAVPLAQARADFVVLGDSLELVSQTVLLARRTLRVVRQNLCWAAGYNALCVPLAVVGWMPAWLAGLGMALSSVWVVINAARLARAMPVASVSRNARAVGAAVLPAEKSVQPTALAGPDMAAPAHAAVVPPVGVSCTDQAKECV